MASSVILIEASPRRADDGSAQTVRLAGSGALYPYRYGGNDWRAGVVQMPTFVTSINFEGGDFGAGGVPSAAELQWAASTKPDLGAVANLYWIDAPVTVRIGAENDAGTLPDVALTGKALSAVVEGGVVKLALADPATDLKKPLLTARYGGTGDLDGPPEWDGKIKPRVWGRVWNRAGECIDKARNIYCWADPLHPIQAFDAVRDKGAPAAELTIVNWQGSAAATLATLRAAAVPPGGGVVCPSLACVRWWTQPAGDLTADLRGEIGTGYVETTADIVARIVAAGPGTAFAAGTIAAARAARPAPVGWVAADDSTTVASMIEQLLGNSSLLWLLNDAGEIVLREWAWGAPVAAGNTTVTAHTASIAANASAIATTNANLASLTTTVSAGAGNLLNNSDFAGGSSAGWYVGANAGVVVGENGVNLPDANWHPADEYCLAMHQLNRVGSDVHCYWYADPISAKPGDVLQAYAYFAAHRAQVDLVLVFMDDSGTWLAPYSTDWQTVGGGGRALSDYTQIGVLAAVAPAGTTRAQMLCLKRDTVAGETESWFWVLRPYIGFARAGQTTFNAYSRATSRAVIQTQATALATASAQIASLTSTVSAQGASITTQATAISTLNSNVATAFARWALQVDANGYTVGIEINNNGSTGAIKFRSDLFEISSPAGGAKVTFIAGVLRFIDSGGVARVEMGIA